MWINPVIEKTMITLTDGSKEDPDFVRSVTTQLKRLDQEGLSSAVEDLYNKCVDNSHQCWPGSLVPLRSSNLVDRKGKIDPAVKAIVLTACELRPLTIRSL